MTKRTSQVNAFLKIFLTINCYPNPTSGNTTLAFNLAEANNLTITLYNAMGETLQVQTEGLVGS